MLSRFLNVLVILTLAFGLPSAAFAQSGTTPEVPVVDVSNLAVDAADSVEVPADLAQADGEVVVSVKLSDAPVSVAVGQGAKQKGTKMSVSQQRNYASGLSRKQAALVTQLEALGGQVMARTRVVLNAVIVKIDAARLTDVAALPGVTSIKRVADFELDLSETVPYIGASEVQALGFDGTGVKVAILDSGIDYTHFNLGGSGDAAEFDANDPLVIEPGSFPTWKVVGGIDFVGETWPNGSLAPDPDPLDKGIGSGHGTHVADITAGKSLDGTHVGVAPGASLYAVKVCSSVSTSCSGVAMVQGLEYAVDPNGDGSVADALDVVNMSLGSSYGQVQDDSVEASANAVRFGVLVVASAGNSADRPYIVGSPSSTPEVLSVAQTSMPNGIAYPLVINAPASIAGTYGNTATVDWAPIGAGFTNDVVYIGRGCPGDPLLASPAGKVALIDRGTCSVSLKTDVGGAAGAVGVLIGLVAPGDAVTFSFGGGTNMVPTLVITQSVSLAIKARLTAGEVVNVTVSTASSVSLAGSMASSSSRGPSFSTSEIKPDIGAPGASVSALAGTGSGTGAFGGTSGAAPMVTGSAALLIQAYPARTALEIKSLLMNTAETTVFTNPATLPGVLAPITRIGGGEVRVNRALASSTAAWDATANTGSLSFGYQSLTGSSSFQKKVLVRNYSSSTKTYTISSAYRYANDAANGAVTLSMPTSITVPANGSKSFSVSLKVDVSKLPNWNLSGGGAQGNGALLQAVEYDGYINLAGGGDNVHLAWQILPHLSAAVTPAATTVSLVDGLGSLALNNATGATNGRVDIFSLLGTSGRIPVSTLPQMGDNFAVIDLKSVGARLVATGSSSYGIQFAINTFGTRAHPAYPAEFDIYIDTNLDGVDDFVVYTAENGTFASTGNTVVYVANMTTGAAAAYYYADADLNSGNMIMTAPMGALGITPVTTIRLSVYAFDNYFTGNLTDSVTGITYTPGTPRYFGTGVPSAGIPAGGSSTLSIQAVPGGDTLSPSQSGLLLMYRDARQQREADAVLVTP